MLLTLVGHFPRKISLNNKAERFSIESADGRSRLQFETMADHSSSYAVENSFLVVNGLLALPLFLFSVYLTVRLRKRAWNTTSKRFTRFLEIFLLLHYFLVVIFCLKFGGRLHYYCFTIGFLAFISVGTNYCIAVSAAALLFQITFPWLSERKKWCLKTNAATWCKVAMEVMGVMLLILYSIISWIGILIYCFWFSKGHITENLFPSVSIVIVFISSVFDVFCVLCLLYLLKEVVRYRRKHKTNTKTELRGNHKKTMLLKTGNHKTNTKTILLLSAIILLDSLVSVAAFAILLLTFVSFKNIIAFYPITVINLLCIIVFIIVTTLLTYERDICCCCYKTQSNEGTQPLINATEGQQTSPVSVWDHGNDPSGTTATVYHPEMTDCRSDIISTIT